MKPLIKEINQENELVESLKVIKESFITVAIELNLTETNCPTNPAFLSFERLKELLTKGLTLFGLYEGNKQIGFMAIEKASDQVYYLEKLAIIPAARHRGNGKKLIDFALNYVKQSRGEKVSLALIDENRVLKDWYIAYGFQETGVKEFPNLPFKVCFMEKAVH